MTSDGHEKISDLAIPADRRNKGRGGPAGLLFLVVVLLIACGIAYSVTRRQDRRGTYAGMSAARAAASTNAPAKPPAPPKSGEPVLNVSGYVIPRERIEMSPKFVGTVRAINVKKGDVVKKGTVLVTLEDDEFRARVLEAHGRLMMAEANLTNAVINLQRQVELAKINAESARALDEARRVHDVAVAEVAAARGALDLAETYLGWCTIRSPIDGTILEKLVNPNELVSPQSFGGSRGPSTAFLAMADLADLQVEIDLNESDTPKVFLKQRCRISPEAYPDRTYGGYVAEIAPEANRAKGTLQVKVQIENPDSYLTPELSAKVDFLAK